MSEFVRGSCLALLTALLAACGGGGSSSPPPNTTPFNIDAAVRGIATASETFSMNGSMMGLAASMVAQHQALPDGAFMGFGTLNQFRRTATVSAAGSTSSSYENDYVDLAGRSFYGLQDDLGNRSVSTSRTPYPASAMIGATGPLYEAAHYDASNTLIGGAHGTWSLEPVAGNANAAYLCINVYFLDTNGTATGVREHDCYRISPTGQRMGMRVTLASPAFGTVQFE